MSAYIPTNVISITDGQIFLESDLFFQGVRPAINVGISVSRVGSNAQTKAMKKVAGRLRVELAQFRALEAFAQFGSDLDQATLRQLSRGQRLVATLNQGQYDPWPMEEQVAIIWATTNGYVDDLPVEEVARFNEGLRSTSAGERAVLEAIRSSGDLASETEEALKQDGRGVQAGLPGAAARDRRRGGRLLVRGEPAGHPAADPFRPQHAQDHQGDGARLRRQAAQGAAAHRARCARSPTRCTT